MRSDAIVAYTYRAETLCEVCTVDKLRKNLPHFGPFHWNASSTEEILDSVALPYRIDRQDERSFDSDVFPKVVFADQIENDEQNRCDGCGEKFYS